MAHDIELLRRIGRSSNPLPSVDYDLSDFFKSSSNAIARHVQKTHASVEAIERQIVRDALALSAQLQRIEEEKDALSRAIHRLDAALKKTESGSASEHATIRHSLASFQKDMAGRLERMYEKSDIDALLSSMRDSIETAGRGILSQLELAITGGEAKYSSAATRLDDIHRTISAAETGHKKKLTAVRRSVLEYKKRLDRLDKVVAEMGYSLQLFVGGSFIGTTAALNFVAGGGISISSVFVNGIPKITISGSGFDTLSSTETPNGNLKVFTFPSASAQPSVIVQDNVLMRATTKSGTVNWTWNAATLQATMSVPPTDEIFAIV